MAQTIVRFSTEQVNALKKDNDELRKKLKGYYGGLAIVTMGELCDGILVPDVNKLPEFVDFVWAFAVFGHKGRNVSEGIICNEIRKFIAGRPYSIAKMAEASSGVKKI